MNFFKNTLKIKCTSILIYIFRGQYGKKQGEFRSLQTVKAVADKTCADFIFYYSKQPDFFLKIRRLKTFRTTEDSCRPLQKCLLLFV